MTKIDWRKILTLEHGVLLGIPHGDGWLVGLLLMGADCRLHLSELALVNHLLLLAPLAIEQLAAYQSLVLHLCYYGLKYN